MSLQADSVAILAARIAQGDPNEGIHAEQYQLGIELAVPKATVLSTPAYEAIAEKAVARLFSEVGVSVGGQSGVFEKVVKAAGFSEARVAAVICEAFDKYTEPRTGESWESSAHPRSQAVDRLSRVQDFTHKVELLRRSLPEAAAAIMASPEVRVKVTSILASSLSSFFVDPDCAELSETWGHIQPREISALARAWSIPKEDLARCIDQAVSDNLVSGNVECARTLCDSFEVNGPAEPVLGRMDSSARFVLDRLGVKTITEIISAIEGLRALVPQSNGGGSRIL